MQRRRAAASGRGGPVEATAGGAATFVTAPPTPDTTSRVPTDAIGGRGGVGRGGTGRGGHATPPPKTARPNPRPAPARWAGMARHPAPAANGAAPDDDRRRVPLTASLGRILQFARPYRGRLAVAIVLTLLSTAAGLVVPLGLKGLLDSVFEASDGGLLNTLAVGLLALFAVQAVLGFGGTYLMEWTGERVVTDLRRTLYESLHRLGLRFFSDQRTGEITSRLTNDVSKVQSAATSDLAESLRLTLTLVGSVGLMLYLNWRLSLVVFAVVPPVAVAMRSFGLVVRKLSRTIQDRLAETTAIAEEAISSVRVVQAFAREAYEVDRYGTAVESLFGTAKRRAWIVAAFWSSVGLLFMTALVVIFWFGGREVIAGRLTAGDLVAFIVYALNIARTVGGAGRIYTSLQSAAGASERLFDLLDTEPDIADAPGATPLGRVRGAVTFRDAWFGYDPDEPILRGVSLEAAPGETVALVGPSGAGKTTLLNLIPRFYDVDAGAVLVDGRDVREVTVRSLREAVSVVAQDVELFGTSILENIRYGRLDATVEEVEEAARAAHAHDFILGLPGGYATEVGERGVKLSGGQRQRVAIARALLKDPPVLLLDEATSALDAESEAAVQDALAVLMRGRTTFVIAHRLATVRDADRILVLDAGRVVERGTHDALVAQGGLYARLAARQFDLERAASDVLTP
ncbi:ABC transporter transmembrane domain-containing protein [Rubrivirga sp. S365]|uniref:ABC transporter transmembrane domain-containing protein n=1 Tax=Rubrivirga litoralis TaxID=3075598 RepID=A0ABU3BV16_9BACT|nr:MULTISPECIES: ABC transporter transmembrane domain-containing protein [unclassified Rubrivirga]MDT0633137.1 ABC transporter transmembrane domain-containing protein [Rubrivirga sp. F394]MDT7857512.1 ABC transporter transmembrane domain-containing protein [Rubrivirga sp. S365]